MSRGAFIVFEGVDRCGKTTQSRKLLEYMQAKKLAAELWRFPDREGTQTGDLINKYLAKKTELNDAAIHLIFSANRWEKSDAMRAKLQEGTCLVVDRYAYSGAAYTSAKNVPGLTLEWCKQPDVGLPAPDLVIYLHMPEAAASQREGFGEERYEKVEFQREVKQRFEKIRGRSWFVIDASQTIETIHAQIVERVEEVLRSCREGRPLGKLWEEEERDPLHALENKVAA